MRNDPNVIVAAELWFAQSTQMPLGAGHIHHTYLVTTPDKRSYVLQQINDSVYLDVELLHEQTQRVIDHLRGHQDYAQRYQVATLILSVNGSAYERLHGQIWRGWNYLQPSSVIDPPRTRLQIMQAARTFADFQRAVASLDPPALKPTIKGFLDWKFYRDQFEEVAHKAPPELLQLIDNVGNGRSMLEGANAYIHGDCKINNLLFDATGARTLAVIDLDNVMWGHWAWDFGDLVRSVSFSRSGFKLTDYQACAQGYLAGMPGRADDIEPLVQAPAHITLMLAMRFLTDHLRGDSYFKVSEAGENLRRAQQQFDVYRQMVLAQDDMRSVCANYTSTRPQDR